MRCLSVCGWCLPSGGGSEQEREREREGEGEGEKGMAERRGGERDRTMQPSAAAAALEEQTVEGALDEIEAALMPMLEMDQTELMDEMDSRHRCVCMYVCLCIYMY